MQKRARDVRSQAFQTLLALILLMAGIGAPILALEENPPAEGFDASGSDAQAIEVADQVMAAMGGRGHWDQTRFIAWNFFGLRTHVWDKWTGNLRFKQGPNVVLMNVVNRQGKVFKDGEEVQDAEAVAKALDNTYKAWINDSYWLLMPYKLKDSGVTLKYNGEAAMADGRAAHVLELTFKDVGVTPQDKYHVFVDKETNLVEQWSFFRPSTETEPRFTNPWAKWQPHGKVLLSGDRGQRQITDIAVYENLPESVFTSPAEVDWGALPKAAP